MIKAVCRTWTHDKPRGAGYEACVTQYVQWVLRLRGLDGSPAAETAAVNGVPVGPRPADADDESQHQQAADRGRRTREKADDQEQSGCDLDHGQRVAHVTSEVVRKDLECLH